jgi:hypothetical protein
VVAPYAPEHQAGHRLDAPAHEAPARQTSTADS